MQINAKLSATSLSRICLVLYDQRLAGRQEENKQYVLISFINCQLMLL